MTNEKASSKKTKTKWLIIIVIILILLAALTWFGWQYFQVKKELSTLTNSPAFQQERLLAETLEKLEKHVILPKNQVPSIATVQDAEALKKENLFYADAKDGDLVIIFQTKAYLYDPKADRVVNIGPVILPSSQTEPSEKKEETKTETKQ